MTLKWRPTNKDKLLIETTKSNVNALKRRPRCRRPSSSASMKKLNRPRSRPVKMNRRNATTLSEWSRRTA